MADLFEQTHVQDLLPAYSIGSLEAGDVSRVEEHLLSCLICRDEAHAFQAVAEQLSLAAPAAIPSADLKERLMQRVRSTRRREQDPAPRPSRPWWGRLLPAWGLESLFLIVVLAASSLVLWQRVNNLEYLSRPGGIRAVPLSPADAASEATGFVLISADGQDGALVVDGLPALEADQEYQLWLIRNGERTSGAVFSTDERSYGGTRIRAPRALTEYSAVGITIEPAGGSPQPTGKQVLKGTLSNQP
jgi:anti-sigma-K factor RskA